MYAATLHDTVADEGSSLAALPCFLQTWRRIALLHAAGDCTGPGNIATCERIEVVRAAQLPPADTTPVRGFLLLDSCKRRALYRSA